MNSRPLPTVSVGFGPRQRTACCGSTYLPKTMHEAARFPGSGAASRIVKWRPPSVERQIPPVELPINTSCEFAGDTAIEFTLPLVMPHAPNHAETVGDGPIGCQLAAACGEIVDSARISL